MRPSQGGWCIRFLLSGLSLPSLVCDFKNLKPVTFRSTCYEFHHGQLHLWPPFDNICVDTRHVQRPYLDHPSSASPSSSAAS